jgi:hypothetical protein
MTDHTEWFETAVHECGHILSMLRWNYRFKSVELWRSKTTGLALGQVQQPSIAAPDYLAMAICALSGPLAAQKLTGVPPGRQRGAWDDLAIARDMLSQVRFPKGLDLDKFPEGLDIEAITPFTSMLIDSEWPRIQWLAAHLAERKQLTYAEVRRWLRLREWMGHEARRYLDAEALAACLTR